MVFFVCVDQVLQHAIKHCGDCKEALDCGADVTESLFITKDLLDDESGHCLGKSLPVLHNPQAKRHYFCLHEEGDSIRVAFLH